MALSSDNHRFSSLDQELENLLAPLGVEIDQPPSQPVEPTTTRYEESVAITTYYLGVVCRPSQRLWVLGSMTTHTQEQQIRVSCVANLLAKKQASGVLIFASPIPFPASLLEWMNIQEDILAYFPYQVVAHIKTEEEYGETG